MFHAMGFRPPGRFGYSYMLIREEDRIHAKKLMSVDVLG